ncbi:hypothetical protein BCR33DRAFT_718414 [Rhizoclosmatium globosum]|uniref:Amino acid permease/ SLC12A domain-containing protein n=1 Tax=Rhizoclosmatium globosum TaxID=329046 RepID=A0A1Y2C5R7_9FUNG|nr:hypothetical protein BCR33DRAFT_718414 [Rhizoclosmatium globosum]|eukprot:ORY42224.1 hypothetical protein BCR33DRAFT_718414 [Rhizoclosmatium globosum]
MATLLPVEGAFSHFPARFVNPALGFAGGWNVRALTFPAEMAGIAALMGFWVKASSVASWVWSLVYMVPLVGINLFAVTGFAEVEFVLCIVKILAIVLFLIIGIFVWFGVGQNTGALGFRYWSPAIQGTDAGDSLLRLGNTFTTAFFSYGGTELVGLTAGEAANPRKSVPRAINGTFWRIIIFYLGALFLVGVLIPPGSSILTSGSIKESPFVYVYSLASINWGADFMNFVIVEGSAPKIFAKVDKRDEGSGHVFDWLSGVISYGIMANWMIMSYTHLRFRRGYLAQGRKVEDLPYVAPFYPYADYTSLTIGAVVTVFLLISAFFPNGVPSDVFFNSQWFYDQSWTYFGVPLTIIFYVGHAALKRHGLHTGRLIETAEEKEENDHIRDKPKNLSEWGKKIWYKLF